ncbi:MAG: VOC family protein [Pseudoruegeria sp.]
MKLGAFSLSLAVKDLSVSLAFYENLGFSVFGGAIEHKFLILKNEETLIGLFQGMFEGPMLTFNPGWDQSAQNTDDFTDVRKIKTALVNAGVPITNEAGGEDGAASFMVTDPDGYPILIDQHR